MLPLVTLHFAVTAKLEKEGRMSRKEESMVGVRKSSAEAGMGEVS